MRVFNARPIRLRFSRAVTAAIRVGVAAGLAASLLVGGAVAALPAGAAAQPSLMPDAGQFVSVPIVNVMSTTSLAAGASVAVPIAGAGFGVPSNAGSVVVVIKSVSATAPGYLSAWNTDSGDSGIASVGLSTGQNNQQMETIPVGPSGSISLANHSAGSVSVSVRVMGYYTGAGTSTAGDTYTGVPWAEIADTSTGLGTKEAPLAAGASVTIQVSGQVGIPAGADTAVLQVNAFSAAANGSLAIDAAGSTPSGLTALTYGTGGTTYRNMYYAALSSSGAVTVTNQGTAAVGFTLYTRGYFMPPATTPAGNEYVSFDPDTVFGTASAGTALAAGASATIQVGGDDLIPSSGVVAVSEDVIVTNAAGTGYVQTGTPGGTMHAAVNFLPTTDTYVGYDNSILTQLSSNGQEQIVNNSNGTVSVQVAVVGYYQSPHSPGSPNAVTATASGSSATVTWSAPDTDGGSPITGYTVTASSDSATATVDGGTYSATLTDLANAATETFSVTAANAAGSSDPISSGPAAQVLTGTVEAPSGAPVAGATVTIETSDPPDPSDTSWTPATIGTAVTGSDGTWSFAVPTFASLPADAQQAAVNNGGTLNISASTNGTATTGGNTYDEAAVSSTSAWVGSGSGTAPATTAAPAAMTMTMQPTDVTDESALDTTANELATPATASDPSATTAVSPDTPNDPAAGDDVLFTGNAASAYTAPLTDAYGYQEIGGNGTYNPFLAADGADLSNVPVTPDYGGCQWTGPWQTVQAGWNWTIVGEQHAYRDATGALTYTKGAQTTIQVAVSVNGGDYGVSGSESLTAGSSFSNGISEGPKASYLDVLALNYSKEKRTWACSSGGAKIYRRIVATGIHSEPSNKAWDPFALGASVLYQDGKAAWQSAPYSSSLSPRTSDCVSKNKGYSYSDGVTIFGVSLSVTTNHSNSTAQCITEGKSTHITHYVWGSNHFIYNAPKRFFSY